MSNDFSRLSSHSQAGQSVLALGLAGGISTSCSLFLNWASLKMSMVSANLNGLNVLSVGPTNLDVGGREWLIGPGLAGLVFILSLIGLMESNLGRRLFWAVLLSVGGLGGCYYAITRIFNPVLDRNLDLVTKISQNFLVFESHIEIGVYVFLVGMLLVVWSGLHSVLSCLAALARRLFTTV